MLWNLQSDKEQMCLSHWSSVTIFYSSVSADVAHLFSLDLEGLLLVPSLFFSARTRRTSSLLLSMARLIKIHRCQFQEVLFCTAWWLGDSSSVGHCADSRWDCVLSLLESLSFRSDLNHVPFQHAQTMDSNQCTRKQEKIKRGTLRSGIWSRSDLLRKDRHERCFWKLKIAGMAWQT